MPTCPVYSSERVYPLLNTLRCKRCKHIRRPGTRSTAPAGAPVPSRQVRKKTDPLEKRLERRN
jgi:hypothetical protein